MHGLVGNNMNLKGTSSQAEMFEKKLKKCEIIVWCLATELSTFCEIVGQQSFLALNVITSDESFFFSYSVELKSVSSAIGFKAGE